MKQSGLVLVFALLILLTMTLLGIAAVSSSLLQSKMASAGESKTVAFEAAEAAINAVVFESEDPFLLADDALTDPLTEARQDVAIDLANQQLSCFNDNNWTARQITAAGLNRGQRHVAAANFSDRPAVRAWSKSAFIGERACKGSSNVIGGSNISCHQFIIRGCGQSAAAPYAVANSLNVSVFAPASMSN